MVASITTLGKSSGGGQPFDGDYFIRLANPEYYTGGGEPLGQWYGAGSMAFGLTGIVGAAEFANVLAGQRPDGASLKEGQSGAKRRRRSKRSTLLKSPKPVVPGYDLCFSAPKSVSALWAAVDSPRRREIELAFDVAVKSTLDWLTANIPLVRRGKGGCSQQLAELVIALFDHGTSRATQAGGWEPQLHRHCVIANIARGEDGRWTAVNSRLLHEWTRTLGPMFRATLARELQNRLGLELTRPLNRQGKPASWFEIVGVPVELCRRWSSRRGEIESLLANSTGLGNFSDAKAREAANLLSRRMKGNVPPREKLFAEWEAVSNDLGLTKGAIEILTKAIPASDAEKAFQQAWKTAQDQLDDQQSTFTFREAVQRVCEASQTSGVAGDWLASRTRQELDQSRAVRPLGIDKGEERFATERTWQIERKLLAELEQLRTTPGASADSAKVASVLESHSHLLADQRQAAEQILGGKNSLRTLIGVAGAGKSTTLDAIRDAFERSGYRVIGGALAGVAQEELSQKAQIPARTVASYLHHLDTPDPLAQRVGYYAQNLLQAMKGASPSLSNELRFDNKTVLILDEAGMIDTRTLWRLSRLVRRSGATLVLVGDTAQLQPISAGGPLTHLTSRDSHPQLSENLRQHDVDDRRASEQFRGGEAAAALQNYAQRARLVVAKDRPAAIAELVAAWTKHGGAENPAAHLIFTPTRAEAEAANRLAQREREAAGLIDQHESLRNGEGVICRGDHVLFHRNRFADGIRNGYRGVVTKVDRFLGTLTIRLDGRETREVTIRLRDYGTDGISLGYAQTTHKGQGQTVDNAYLLVGGKLADREMAYVQATRARHSTHLFVDELHAGPELKELTRALSRSRRKELAHDVAARCANDLNHERNL